MNQQEFDDAFTMLATLCGKKANNELKKFYFNRIQKCENEAIRSAFAFFGNSNKWPSVNDFWEKCSYDPNASKTSQEFERGEPRWDDLMYRLICTRRGSTLDSQEAELRNTVEIHGARGDYYAVRDVDGAKRDTWERHIFGAPKTLEQPKQESKFKLPSTDYKSQAAGDIT